MMTRYPKATVYETPTGNRVTFKIEGKSSIQVYEALNNYLLTYPIRAYSTTWKRAVKGSTLWSLRGQRSRVSSI